MEARLVSWKSELESCRDRKFRVRELQVELGSRMSELERGRIRKSRVRESKAGLRN